MALSIELSPVRRNSGGRIHLTAVIPESGPVTTLCDQQLPEGTYRAGGAQADCSRCLKRKDDPARVSSALFEAGLGESLLEMSLLAARQRRKTPPPPPEADPKPSRPAPPQVTWPELTGLRQVFDRVYQSPQGVVIRISEEAGDWRVEEVQFEGRMLTRRRPDGGFDLIVGDVSLQYTPGDGRLRLQSPVHI